MASNNAVSASMDRCKEPDSVDLTPLSSLEGLCPGKILTFLCRIYNDSRVLSWSSEEYVHDMLQFTVNDIPGPMSVITDQVHMDTMGNYNGSEKVNGTVVSGRSLLWIKLRADAPTATVTCHNVDNDCNRSISFQLLGMYNIISAAHKENRYNYRPCISSIQPYISYAQIFATHTLCIFSQ